MAFVLREVEELDSNEICRTMEISRSNLGVLLYRGRNLLRECLEKRNIRG
jgi:RNA polymerase sigma-70 factor (ECF subfamily)